MTTFTRFPLSLGVLRHNSTAKKSFNLRNAAILHDLNLGHQGAPTFKTLAENKKTVTIGFLNILPDEEFMTISSVIGCSIDR